MGEKISDYINSASATPNNQSLLDLSEFNGSTYESVKWELADFLTWLTNNVSFSEVYTFYNNSGATLEKGTPVKIDSLQSGVVAVNDYQLLPNNASSQIFVAKEQILNGAQGVFFKAGLITDVDTSSFSVGQTIYYNYTTNLITNVYASDVIYLGIVITSAVSGSIFVAPEKAESVGSNIYSSDGTLTANRIMDGANNELLFQTMGKFSVHSHANNIDNVVFEVRSQSGYESFTIRDHNTGDHLFCVENGKVEINNAYFLPDVDGTAGQVMKTDGLGNVTWQNESVGVSGSGTNERLAVWSPNATTLDDTEIYYNVAGSRVGFGANYTPQNRVYIEQTSNGEEPLRVQTVRGDLTTANSIVGISNVANSVSGLTNNGVIGVGHGQTDIDSYNIGVTGQAGNIRPTISKKGNIGGLFYTQLGNRTNYGAQFITTGSNTEDNYGIFIENYNLGSGDSHAVWIMDRNEAVGKVLMSRTNDGKGGWEPLPYDVNFACGDEVTPIVVASALTTLRAPRSFKINSVRASLTTAGGTSGVTRFDIKVNGTSILNPIAPLEIDFGDKTSATATNQPIIAISSVFVDSEITVDCTAITGSGTEAGAKIYLIGELE